MLADYEISLPVHFFETQQGGMHVIMVVITVCLSWCQALTLLCLRVLCVQAAAHTAEQQVSSLEAALQKGSQVTVSMTEKVAQALSAANSQVESLKVTWGAIHLATDVASTDQGCHAKLLVHTAAYSVQL
jgi:hypothetical protein